MVLEPSLLQHKLLIPRKKKRYLTVEKSYGEEQMKMKVQKRLPDIILCLPLLLLLPPFQQKLHQCVFNILFVCLSAASYVISSNPVLEYVIIGSIDALFFENLDNDKAAD